MLPTPGLTVKPRRPRIVAQWFARMDGVYYKVERVEVPEDDEIVSRAYRLFKDGGTIYDVSHTIYGNVCDCPDFIFHKQEGKYGECKHILALESLGVI